MFKQIIFGKIREYNKKNEMYTHYIDFGGGVLVEIIWNGKWNWKVHKLEKLVKGKINLNKIMEECGFKKVKYPVGPIRLKKYAIWYVKEKIPYGTAISKEQILKIIKKITNKK